MNPIDWTLPAEAILSDLLTEVWVPNEQGVTIAMTEAALASMPGAADLVLATFTAAQQPAAATVEAIAKAGRMQSAFIAMSSEKGLLLSTPDRQEMIDQLAAGGQWPDAVRDAIKALGGYWAARWQAEGSYSQEPTLSGVVKQKIVNNTRSVIDSKSTAVVAWLDAIDLGQFTESQLQEYCDQLLASADGNPNSGGE